MSFSMYAQKNEMQMNENYIVSNTVFNSNFKSELIQKSVIDRELNLILEKSNDTIFEIYLVNRSKDTLKLSKQDWHLFLIQEAKNINGEWKPVEYWQYSTCGNSYLTEKLEPNGILKTETKAYKGNFETQIRFKLLNNSHIYYSNSIIGFVDLKQFEIPKNIDESGLSKRAKMLGGFDLLNKILFLEPNGMNELSEKQDEYLEKMAELRKKNKK